MASVLTLPRYDQGRYTRISLLRFRKCCLRDTASLQGPAIGGASSGRVSGARANETADGTADGTAGNPSNNDQMLGGPGSGAGVRRVAATNGLRVGRAFHGILRVSRIDIAVADGIVATGMSASLVRDTMSAPRRRLAIVLRRHSVLQ